MRATLTALVHGEAGIGKSWFADTAPGPKLVLDAEGRAKYTPSQPKVYWDPRQGPPPAADGTWETCICLVPDFDTIRLVYEWLRSGQHPFVSVIVDSLMEVQKRAQDVIVPGTAQLQMQDWGELLRRLEKMVRSYRDLTLVNDSTVQVVLFITGTREGDSKDQLLLQGQLRDIVAYIMDVVGYMFKAPQADGTFVRSLLVDKQPGFLAKDNTDRLVRTYGSVVPEPNIMEILRLLNGFEETTIVAAPERSVA